MSFIIGRGSSGGGATKTLYFEPQFDNNYGSYRVRSVGQNASTQFTFQVPEVAITINKIVLIGIADGNIVSGNIDLTSEYGGIGEAYNVNSEVDTTTTYNANINEITEFPIDQVFSSVDPGDACGVLVVHNTLGATINYLGVLMEYV